VDTDDYKIKNALDGAKGSLQAVIDFLSKNGVAKARYVATRTIIHA
jgi:translation elongation factor EF-Ts